MGIAVISAQSVAELLPSLANRLATKQQDPFAPDIVVVPGIGVADWVVENLSSYWGSNGIVANVEFWLPNEFNVKAGVKPDMPLPTVDVGISRWLVLEHLLNELDAGNEVVPGFASTKRKVSFARNIAELFDRYLVHRPEMIANWRSGGTTDGLYELPSNHQWQPRLWRALYEQSKSFVQLFPEASSSISKDADPRLSDGRLTMFGMESFSRTKIDLLRQFSKQDVAVFHVTPVPSAVQKMRDVEITIGSVRNATSFPVQFNNLLLQSWGQSVLENSSLLATIASSIETIESTKERSVLTELQSHLKNDVTDVSIDSDDFLNLSDGTIQIHSCHGATRQVEVLRDALLHQLDADPTLSPRDIIVICRDIENFAPLLDPVMAAAVGKKGQHLSVAVLDRIMSTATPVAMALDGLLDLLSGRCTAPELIEVIGLEPIRQKLELTDECLSAISQWTSQLNVKWGLTSQHREKWNISGEFEHGTWLLAVDRLVAGIMNQSLQIQEHFPGVAAFDDVSGSSIEAIGKLHYFVTSLAHFSEFTDQSHTIAEWAAFLSSLLNTFISDNESKGKMLSEVHSLAASLTSMSAYAPTAELSLSEFREIVAGGLPSQHKGTNKWRDVVRVGSPHRLRGVSARVIGVLGFDEDSFKGAGHSSDDILLLEPRIGERDGRMEERLGILTLINSTRDCLIVTYNGHDVTNNKEVSAAVPLVELKDAVVRAIASIPPAQRSHVPLVISHSRQLADPVNVGVSVEESEKNVQKLTLGKSWTFDHTAVTVVERLQEIKGMSLPASVNYRTVVLEPPDESVLGPRVQMNDLVSAVRRPLDVFVSSRLGVLLPRDEEVSDYLLQLWPDVLSQSDIGRAVLQGVTNGESADEVRKQLDLQGKLPLGNLGDAVWEKISEQALQISAAAKDVLRLPHSDHSCQVHVIGDILNDAIEAASIVEASISTYGNVVLSLNYSSWSRRLRLVPWLQLAALTIHDPETSWTSFVVARPSSNDKKVKEGEVAATHVVEEFQLSGNSAEERLASAQRVLRFSLSIQRRALRAPVPLFERSSWIHDATKTDVAKQMGFDLERPSHQLIYGEFEYQDFLQEELLDDIDDGLPQTVSRFMAYSELLTTTWDGTTHVLRAADKPKAKKSTSSKKSSRSATTEALDGD